MRALARLVAPFRAINITRTADTTTTINDGDYYADDGTRKRKRAIEREREREETTRLLTRAMVDCMYETYGHDTRTITLRCVPGLRWRGNGGC